MERTVISWTPENWLTVILMVTLGWWAIACAARLVHKAKGGSDNA
jgi:hypothetical protein